MVSMERILRRFGALITNANEHNVVDGLSLKFNDLLEEEMTPRTMAISRDVTTAARSRLDKIA